MPCLTIRHRCYRHKPIPYNTEEAAHLYVAVESLVPLPPQSKEEWNKLLLKRMTIMKKVIFVLMLFVGMTVSAQTDHLKFKGIPIDGTLTSFVNKLKQKGFTVQHTEKGTAMLTGEFAAVKGCTAVVTEHESGVVNRVAVMFPSKDSWAMLYHDYSNLKDMLTQKYGEPAAVEEEFQDRSYEMNDNDRMHEVRMDRCRYICDWTPENGTIELRIQNTSLLGSMVVLVYIDADNEAKVREKALEDL